MKDQPDIVLLERVLRGERNLFPLLVDRYGPLVQGLASRYLIRPEDVFLVSQRVFEKTYLSLRRIDDIHRFLPSLLEFTRMEIQALPPSLRRNPQDDPMAIHESLQPAFPPHLERILKMKYGEGKTYREIGEKLGMKEDEVEQILRIARNQYRWIEPEPMAVR